MLKKLIPIIPIGLSIFVVALVLVCAVFVKPEQVVPVQPPVVNNVVTPAPPIPTPPIPTPPIPTPPVVPFVEDDDLPEIDTSDWEVYNNEEFGFEFKYPNDFELSDTEETYKPTNSKRIVGMGFCLDCSMSFDNGMYFKIFYSDDQSKYPDLDELFESTRGCCSKETTLVEKYRYRNFEGVKIETIKSVDQVQGDILELYLKTSDGFCTFFWEAVDPENRGFNYRDYFIPMLSTFKFIE